MRSGRDYAFSVPHDANSIPVIRARLRETANAASAQFPADSMNEWCAVGVEAIGNIVRHAPDRAASATIAVHIRYRAHHAVLTAVDAGRAYRLPPPGTMVPCEAESGRGFAMIYAWCARVSLRRVANHNILRLHYVDRHRA